MINFSDAPTNWHDIPCLVVFQGLPGSGKSTQALKFADTFKNVVRVNRDTIRLMFKGKWTARNEGLVMQIRDSVIRLGLSAGHAVICDDTNLTPKHLQSLAALAGAYEVPVYFKSFMHVSVEECIANDLKRPESVGKDVIERMYYQYWESQPLPANHGARSAIICDLDGTLALLPEGMSYPAAFERDYRKDRLNIPVAQIIGAAGRSGYGPDVILVSGRFGERRHETEEWLEFHDIPYKYLFTRTAGDRRDDSIVKKEIYMNEIQGKFEIDYVLDDRPRVVRMWRAELGLPVLQVAPNIEF